MNWIPMAEQLAWPSVARPSLPLVYLDLNHFIYLARAKRGHSSVPAGYDRLLDAATRAFREQRALFPLSGEHLFEVMAIKDPAQRRHIADVMEALSGFRYMLGRPDVARLEFEAGIERLLGEARSAPQVPLLGRGFRWAFGMVGGMQLVDNEGRAASTAARHRLGDEMYESFISHANHTVERAMLDGPADHQIADLRANGYAPEIARAGHDSRLAFELDLSERLAADPARRKRRLRDLVSAREITHEWLETLNRIQGDRANEALHPFNPSDGEMRELMAALPHVQVAITLKTAYHRNPAHRWTTNDVTDIDAMSVAYTYCDAVFTDKAIRAALANSRDLRQIPTFLPRTPGDLADWLDAITTLPAPWRLVPVARASTNPHFAPNMKE